MSTTLSPTAIAATPRGFAISPTAARLGFLLVVCAAIAAGFVTTGADATAAAIARDGADLTRLMRFMAGLKAMIAVGATAAVFWRMGTAITPPWFGAYALTTAAMAAGPGLIWGMAHVGVGALLLHGGLFATILLLWRDPAVARRLGALVAARRAALKA